MSEIAEALVSAVDLADLPGATAGFVRDLALKVASLTKELTQTQARLDYFNRIIDEDPVALVLNRQAFLREGQRACLLARRHKIPVALLYLNVDGFRHINERFGSRGGDAVLLELGQRLQTQVRNSDLVGRVGADEFGALLMHSDAAAATRKGLELAAGVASQPISFVNERVPMSITWTVQSFDGATPFGTMLDVAGAAILAQRRDARTAQAS